MSWRRNGLARRGTSNGNSAGSSYDRRARRDRMWKRHASKGWIKCWWCPRKMRRAEFEVDRVVCGHANGRYTDDNVVPSCRVCNRVKCSAQCRVGCAAPRIAPRMKPREVVT